MSVISGVTSAVMGDEAADMAGDAQVSSAKMSADVQKYMYNNDAADSAGISLYWFKGDRNKLVEEN